MLETYIQALALPEIYHKPLINYSLFLGFSLLMTMGRLDFQCEFEGSILTFCAEKTQFLDLQHILININNIHIFAYYFIAHKVLSHV